MKIGETDIGKLIYIDEFRDGGTVSLQFESGSITIDHRIRTETEGKIFFGYPEDGLMIINNRMLSDIICEVRNFNKHNEYEGFNKFKDQIVDELSIQYNL